MNKVGICDKCKAINYTALMKKIKNIDENIQFVVGCQNMCGIGKNKTFVILNRKPIIGDNEEDLINKIKNML